MAVDSGYWPLYPPLDQLSSRHSSPLHPCSLSLTPYASAPFVALTLSLAIQCSLPPSNVLVRLRCPSGPSHEVSVPQEVLAPKVPLQPGAEEERQQPVPARQQEGQGRSLQVPCTGLAGEGSAPTLDIGSRMFGVDTHISQTMSGEIVMQRCRRLCLLWAVSARSGLSGRVFFRG